MLKVLVAIEFVLISAIIALALMDSSKMPTAEVAKEIPSVEKADFRVLTKAVCEEKSEHIVCHDKLFIKCNEKERMINEDGIINFTCGNTELNLPEIKAVGRTIFKKGWVDPRNKSELR